MRAALFALWVAILLVLMTAAWTSVFWLLFLMNDIYTSIKEIRG